MFLSIRQPGSYIFQSVFKLPQDIDLDRFKRAWDLTAKRNAILRTRIIHTEASGSLQVVMKEPMQWVPTEGTVKEYIEQDRQQVMALGVALARYAIIRPNHDDRRFVWTAHHSLYDGWSLPLILFEVERAYMADGSPGPSPPPFSRFIEYIQGIDWDEVDSYWRDQFAMGTPTSFPAPQSERFMPWADTSVTRTVRIGSLIGQGIMSGTLIRAAWALVLLTMVGQTTFCSVPCSLDAMPPSGESLSSRAQPSPQSR